MEKITEKDGLCTRSYYIQKTDDLLRVACVNESVGDWSAYIKKTYSWRECADWGDKIDKPLAVLFFPKLAAEYRWRY